MIISATFLGVLETIGYVLIGLLALMFMVVIHELGHYLAGKALGFKILEFGIGFGPALFKKTNKKTGEIFSIRPIPLGGFCSFEEEDGESDSPTAFNNQAPWKRIIVLFAGAFSNFISGLVIITIFFCAYGQLLPTVHYVYEDSANFNILQEGDAILRVDGKQVNVLLQEDMSSALSKAGDTAEFVVLRNGERIELTVSKSDYMLGDLDENDNFTQAYNKDGTPMSNYGFGIATILNPTKLSFFTAFGRSFSFMFFLVFKILVILLQLVTGKLALNSVGGPVTTIKVMTDASRGGLATLSYVVCLISANLAVMNLLPIPALDGARIVFCLIEWIFKKPVPKKVEGIIHTIGFLLIFAFAIFADIWQWVG